MELYLVGTIHLDMKGPERLTKFLSFIRPSHILCEGTKENAKETLKQRVAIKEQLRMYREHKKRSNGLETQLGTKIPLSDEDKQCKLVLELLASFGFENYVPYEHSKLYPTNSIISLDNPKLYKKALGAIAQEAKSNGNGNHFNESGVTEDFFQEIANLPFDRLKEFIANLEKSYEDDLESLGKDKTIQESVAINRDEYFERIIRDTTSIGSVGNVVAIAGTYHIFGPYHNLCDRLSDLNPMRLRLNEVDKY